MSWFRVNMVGDVAHLSLFDEIGFSEGNVDDLLSEIADAKDVELFINSSGGSGDVAQRIIEAIKGRCSVCHIVGHCASAAVHIAVSAAKHIRIVEGGTMMVHGPVSWALVTSANLPEIGRMLERCEASLIDALSKRVCDPDIVRTWITGGRDVYFTADEAWHARLVDEIYSLPKKPGVSRVAADSQEPAEPSGPSAPRGNEPEFFRLLDAFGVVETADPNRLLREFRAWLSCHSRQL